MASSEQPQTFQPFIADRHTGAHSAFEVPDPGKSDRAPKPTHVPAPELPELYTEVAPSPKRWEMIKKIGGKVIAYTMRAVYGKDMMALSDWYTQAPQPHVDQPSGVIDAPPVPHESDSAKLQTVQHIPKQRQPSSGHRLGLIH